MTGRRATPWYSQVVRLLIAGTVLISAAGPLAADQETSDEDAPLATAAPTLYALLVFDTHAVDIGEEMAIDRENIVRVLFNAFNTDGQRQRLEMRVLEADEATPARILKYYADLETTPADSLFFYYSGHGGMELQRGHFLAMRHGNLFRSDLRGALQSQPCHRQVLLTDCCANYVDEVVDIVESVPYLPPERTKEADWQVAKDLFFGGEGLVDVNAASPGGVSVTNTNIGSYFTVSLAYNICRDRGELDLDGNESVTWEEFMRSVDNHILQEYLPRDRQQSHTFYVDEWPQRFHERNLLVRNETELPVTVYVEYLTAGADGEPVWQSPKQTWTFAPGESGPLPVAANPDSVIKAQQVRIWAQSQDGRRSWTEHQTSGFELCNPRFGYAATETETQVYTFRE